MKTRQIQLFKKLFMIKRREGTETEEGSVEAEEATFVALYKFWQEINRWNATL